MKAKQLVMIVLAVIVVILIIQNSVTIPLNLLFWPMYMPLFLLVLGVLAVGLVIGYLAAKTDRSKKKKAAPAPEAKTAVPAPPDNPPLSGK